MKNVLPSTRRPSFEALKKTMVKLVTHKIFRQLTFLMVFTVSLTHLSKGQVNVEIEREFTSIVDEWYTSIGKGELGRFQDMLTDDFQLIAFGDRINKEQVLGVIKDYSDVAYVISNVRYGSGVSIGFIICDVELSCKFQGLPILGKASEVYIFKKVGTRWKIDSKTIMMM